MRYLFLLLFFLFSFTLSAAEMEESTGVDKNIYDTGFKLGDVFESGFNENVNLSNGQFVISLKLVDLRMRNGMRLPVTLRYNSGVWSRQVQELRDGWGHMTTDPFEGKLTDFSELGYGWDFTISEIYTDQMYSAG